MSDEEEVRKPVRSFKVKLSQETPAYGRYNGDSPYQAANKALSELVRNAEKNGEDATGEYYFWLIESTKKSKKRVHQYRGQRIKLDVPVEYTVGDNVIVKNYKNFLKKIKKDEQEELITKATKKAKTTKKTTKKAKVAKKAVAKTAKASAKTTKKVVAPKGAKATKATAKVAKKVTSKKTSITEE